MTKITEITGDIKILGKHYKVFKGNHELNEEEIEYSQREVNRTSRD